ncbi:uncharacterized protein LOC121374448 [Gigantopelta aegis]|uniref:uncharacterized protein LOC121374448 n=1 Tax=Gigantopelta aegis TaxID=1735272 RepID=UPI001B88D1D0|nr:uncharacterized protein LOC121374448 [Gigantopelta aegis]
MEYFQSVLYLLVTVIPGGGFTTVDYTGTEFLITFTRNLYSTGALYVRLSAERNASVTIQNNLLVTSTSMFVPGGTSVQVSLPDNTLRYSSDLAVEQKSLYISSTSPISVHTLNYYKISTDGYHAIPVKALSTEYITVSYPVAGNNDGRIVVAAVEDDTVVKINFKLADGGTCSGSQLGNGQEGSYSLNRYDVIGTACTGDFTGTIVTSNKPITVLVGHKCAKVPLSKDGCDKLEEMLPPTQTFGNSFVLHHLGGRDTGALYRIVAKDNDTTVNSSNGQTFSINRGDFVELDTLLTGQLCITSTRPVLVVLIAKGKHAGDNVGLGDPFLSIVPSTRQYLPKTFVSYQMDLPIPVKYYVTVVVQKDDVAGLSTSVNFVFVNIPSCDYVVATVEQTSKTLTVNTGSSVPVGIMTYGLGVNDPVGFGYPVGMALDIDECLSGPCLNNGTCQDGIYSYNCVCSDTFTGILCETALTADESSSFKEEFSTKSFYREESTNIDLGVSLTSQKSTTDITQTLESSGTYSYGDSDLLSTEFQTLNTPSPKSEQTILKVSSNNLPENTNMATSFYSSVDITDSQAISVSQNQTISVSPSTINAVSLNQILSISPSTISAVSENQILSSSLNTFSADSQNQIVSVSTSTIFAVSENQILSSSPNTVSTDSQNQIISISPSTISAVSEKNVISVCSCSCRGQSTQTQDSVSQYTEQIRVNLTVDTTTLGKTIRKYISVHDDRPSAQAVGAVGLLFVFIVVCFIVLPDVLSTFSHIHRIVTERNSNIQK